MRGKPAGGDRDQHGSGAIENRSGIQRHLAGLPPIDHGGSLAFPPLVQHPLRALTSLTGRRVDNDFRQITDPAGFLAHVDPGYRLEKNPAGAAD